MWKQNVRRFELFIGLAVVFACGAWYSHVAATDAQREAVEYPESLLKRLDDAVRKLETLTISQNQNVNLNTDFEAKLRDNRIRDIADQLQKGERHGEAVGNVRGSTLLYRRGPDAN